jgi:hypothetical protein
MHAVHRVWLLLRYHLPTQGRHWGLAIQDQLQGGHLRPASDPLPTPVWPIKCQGWITSVSLKGHIVHLEALTSCIMEAGL